jgi:ribosomal protein L40E
VQFVKMRRGGCVLWAHGTARKLRTVFFTTAANQPTAADYCRQCGRSTDLEKVATVDGNVLVSAVTYTLCNRCNSQIPQGGRTTATGTFKNVPIDLVSAFCDAKPWLWRKITVRSTVSKRRVKYVTTRMEGITSRVSFHDKHGDPPRVREMKSRTRAERAQARVEQYKRRGSFSWARLTDNGDIVSSSSVYCGGNGDPVEKRQQAAQHSRPVVLPHGHRVGNVRQ